MTGIRNVFWNVLTENYSNTSLLTIHTAFKHKTLQRWTVLSVDLKQQGRRGRGGIHKVLTDVPCTCTCTWGKAWPGIWLNGSCPSQKLNHRQTCWKDFCIFCHWLSPLNHTILLNEYHRCTFLDQTQIPKLRVWLTASNAYPQPTM